MKKDFDKNFDNVLLEFILIKGCDLTQSVCNYDKQSLLPQV